MDWLNSNSGAITAIATAVLAIITVIYVFMTYRILKAMNKPEITVYLRPHEANVNNVMLSIENVGTGVARELRFTGDLSLGFKTITQFKDIDFPKNGIDVLGPGQKINHFLVSTLENSDVLKQPGFELTVTYSDSSGNHEDKKIFHLNLGEYEGTTTIGGVPLFEIAKAAKKIQNNLEKPTR